MVVNCFHSMEIPKIEDLKRSLFVLLKNRNQKK
jgi:hypothetical protein